SPRPRASLRPRPRRPPARIPRPRCGAGRAQCGADRRRQGMSRIPAVDAVPEGAGRSPCAPTAAMGGRPRRPAWSLRRGVGPTSVASRCDFSRQPIFAGVALLTLALLLAGCGLPGTIAMEGRIPVAGSAPTAAPLPPVRMPQDEAPHRNLTEWWYYTGHFA